MWPVFGSRPASWSATAGICMAMPVLAYSSPETWERETCTYTLQGGNTTSMLQVLRVYQPIGILCSAVSWLL